MYQISYLKSWAAFYLFMGSVTGLIFIIGGIFLKDYLLFAYLLASFYLVGIGISMRKNPYCFYDYTEIKIFGHFGMVRKVYRFDGPGDIKIYKNRLYINGKKLKLNQWMINRVDWERLLEFYAPDDEALLNELN